MIEVLEAFTILCIAYFIYGIGVIRGKRHEKKRQKMKQEEINRLAENRPPSRKSYSWYKNDGYEIFHVNVN